MNYLLPDYIYDILKWVGLILCPALAVLVSTVGPAWNIPNVEPVVITINAIGLFIGSIIGASQLAAKGEDDI